MKQLCIRQCLRHILCVGCVRVCVCLSSVTITASIAMWPWWLFSSGLLIAIWTAIFCKKPVHLFAVSLESSFFKESVSHPSNLKNSSKTVFRLQGPKRLSISIPYWLQYKTLTEPFSASLAFLRTSSIMLCTHARTAPPPTAALLADTTWPTVKS